NSDKATKEVPWLVLCKQGHDSLHISISHALLYERVQSTVLDVGVNDVECAAHRAISCLSHREGMNHTHDPTPERLTRHESVRTEPLSLRPEDRKDSLTSGARESLHLHCRSILV